MIWGTFNSVPPAVKWGQESPPFTALWTLLQSHALEALSRVAGLGEGISMTPVVILQTEIRP